MKIGYPEKILAGLLLVVLGGIVLHAPFTVFFGSLLPDFALYLKAWKEVLMLFATIFAFVVVYRNNLRQRLVNDWLVRLVVIYIVLHVVMLLLFWTGVQAVFAGLAIDLRHIIYFLLIYVLLNAAPHWRSAFVKTAIAGAVVVIAFGVMQLFLPHDTLKHIGYDKNTTIAPYLTVDQNYEYIRINSTLRGPNPLGAYAVIVLSGIVAAVLMRRSAIRGRKALAVAFLSVMATAAVLWVSYSRSAIGGALIALGLVVLLAYGKLIHRYVWISLAAVALLVGGGVYAARNTDFVSHVILHEDPGEGNDVNSNDGHLHSLVFGIERMVAQPLGAGVGSTGSASLLTDEPVIIENHYLFVAHETGWVGLGLFMAIFGMILWRLYEKRYDWLAVALFASGVGLAAIGVLLPVWVDDTVAIVWWGLVAVALAAPRKVKKEVT